MTYLYTMNVNEGEREKFVIKSKGDLILGKGEKDCEWIDKMLQYFNVIMKSKHCC